MIQALTADYQPGRDLDLRVVVRNAGSRPGREVVQAYLAGPPGDRSRPARVLAAFGIAEVAPGEQAEVLLRIPARLFAHSDDDRDPSILPPAPSTVLLGRYSRA